MVEVWPHREHQSAHTRCLRRGERCSPPWSYAAARADRINVRSWCAKIDPWPIVAKTGSSVLLVRCAHSDARGKIAGEANHVCAVVVRDGHKNNTLGNRVVD